MIESIEFTNYKALRKTTLLLEPFTLLLGPNGSGKTSVLQALQGIVSLARLAEQSDGTYTVPIERVWPAARSVAAGVAEQGVTIKVRFRWQKQLLVAVFEWHGEMKKATGQLQDQKGVPIPSSSCKYPLQWLSQIQIYTLDAAAICQPAAVSSRSMQPNGAGLAAVLDDLKDNHPERWEALLAEVRRWLPEYDFIQFDKPNDGLKMIVLRTKRGSHRIPAPELSQGTLVALALLTLAYLPNPPSVVGLEEIDRGLHPRLLRHLQDALYRLSYPESCGEKRPPIQVIATTHSPYLLDLYREHPNEVVLAEKEGLEVKMTRLTDIEHYQEILGDSPLSEMWYSGVLGGVSVKP